MGLLSVPSACIVPTKTFWLLEVLKLSVVVSNTLSCFKDRSELLMQFIGLVKICSACSEENKDV